MHHRRALTPLVISLLFAVACDLEPNTDLYFSEEANDHTASAEGPPLATAWTLENDEDQHFTPHPGRSRAESALQRSVTHRAELGLPPLSPSNVIEARWFIRGDGMNIQNTGLSDVFIAARFKGEVCSDDTLGRVRVDAGSSIVLRPQSTNCHWLGGEVVVYDDLGHEHDRLITSPEMVEIETW